MTESIACYKDDKHHLRDELRRLDSLLRPAVQRARIQENDSDPFKGLYISDEDADHLLEERIPQGQNLFLSSSKAAEIQAVKASADKSAENRLQNGNETWLRKLAGPPPPQQCRDRCGANLPGCGTRSEILEVHSYHQDGPTVKLP